MKARILLIAFVLLFLTIINGSSVSFSATQSLSLNNVPVTVDQSGEFEIGITLSCPSCTTDSFLRGVFYPSGTSYFGYTKDNNGNWSNAAGGNCTTYFKVAQTDLSKEGSWSGALRFKSDKDSPNYNGPGEYLFKVGRYTPSCSSPSIWSTETTVAITGPTPTLTPVPPTSTTVPTPIIKPTATPTSLPSPTKTPTPKPTSTKTPSPTGASVLGVSQKSIQSVLGDSDEKTREKTKAVVPGESKSKTIGILFIFLGVIFLSLCGIVFFLSYRNSLKTNGS